MRGKMLNFPRFSGGKRKRNIDINHIIWYDIKRCNKQKPSVSHPPPFVAVGRSDMKITTRAFFAANYFALSTGGCHPFFYWEKLMEVITISKELRVNEQIRCREIRVIDEQGSQIGVMNPRDAMKLADEKGLDLVEVSPGAKPPVCRIMDYGKYRYEQNKKERETRKNQKVISIKEVKLRPNIEDHDFNTKVRNAAKFLAAGDKVKVTIMFRGREVTRPEAGKELCDRVAQEVANVAKVEKEAKVEGRNMTMMLVPLREKDKEKTK